MDIEYLYQRYNNFFNEGITIQNPYTLFAIFLEDEVSESEINRKIIEYEIKKNINFDRFQELAKDKDFIQPKSIFMKLYYIELILSSLSQMFLDKINLSARTIEQITMSIVLYYIGLQTYKNLGAHITDTQRKYLFGREDYYFGIYELKKVCGEITEDQLARYLELFAADICLLEPDSKERLYSFKGQYFILCIEEFVEYVMFKIEELYRVQCSEKEFSEYTRNKGFGFEEIVFDVLENVFSDIHHTMYYYPNEKKKIEVDIIARDKSRLAIFECKSGTINIQSINEDAYIKTILSNKIKKAYKSLMKASEYVVNSPEYSFSNGDDIITGHCENPVLINVSMYPFDFISSNVHTLFPKYIEGIEIPVLTISLEHLFAIIIDSMNQNRSLFDYWEARKKYIISYPKMQFENNELDLYYEVVNEDKNTMLAELKKQGILERMNPDVKIIGTYHDCNGNEVRPASMLLKKLDESLLHGLLTNGKQWFGINKRYLKYFEELITVDI